MGKDELPSSIVGYLRSSNEVQWTHINTEAQEPEYLDSRYKAAPRTTRHPYSRIISHPEITAKMSPPPLQSISPLIFYWGTPVVLVTTENEDGSTNIAPMSSAWWLGNRCMLGLASSSQTTHNLLRTKQCVLNLASDSMAASVNALAKTTGTKEVITADKETSPVLYFKRMSGYEYVADKFERSRLTALASQLVRPCRLAECPAQMEGELMGVHEMMQDLGTKALVALEVKILRTHVHEDIRMVGYANRIDPDKWRPLIMSFQELYGLARKKISDSTLAEIDEEQYRPLSNSLKDEGIPGKEEKEEVGL
jgi:flavin reductase (DIM6/NTAB) family NADH-FMN oxidoreductase RutF